MGWQKKTEKLAGSDSKPSLENIFLIDNFRLESVKRTFDLCELDRSLDICTDEKQIGTHYCSVVTPGGQLLIATRGARSLYKLGTCGLERLDVEIWSGPNDSCGPHPDGALFCGGKNCYLYNEKTGEVGDMQYQHDYHYGGNMAYIDGEGPVIIGGSSPDTAGGRIEAFYEKLDGAGEKWHQVNQRSPTAIRVVLPLKYKWFTVTKEPHCTDPSECNGLMLFGGYGCDADNHTNCDFTEESYITEIETAGCTIFGCVVMSRSVKNSKIDRLVEWEMPNVHGYKTIDSVLDRDSGFLVHAQTFNCKGPGSNIFPVFSY